MMLAEKRLPNGPNAGNELFDKLGALGLPSFMQEVTRVRALEGRTGAHDPVDAGRRSGARSDGRRRFMPARVAAAFR